MKEPTNNQDSKTGLRSERIARNWDLLSIASFGAAIVVGLVKTANDIRHQFLDTFVFRKGGPGEKNPFQKILDEFEPQFAKVRNDLSNEKISAPEFSKELHAIADKRFTKINEKIAKDFKIPTHNPIADWTIGTYKRLHHLGRTNRLSAAVGFAGTATIAIGAMAVLKHSSRVLDSINQKIDTQKHDERSM